MGQAAQAAGDRSGTEIFGLGVMGGRAIAAIADTGVYSYEYSCEGSDRRMGESIYLWSREVSGTEARPVYTFRNGETAYVVTFRDNDYNTIRLQVYQQGRSVLNQLLQRR